MQNRLVEFSGDSRAVAAKDGLKILAVCPATARDLGGALERVLLLAPNIELIWENPADGGFAGALPRILNAVSKCNLLMMCVPSESITDVEIVLEAVQSRNLDRSVLVVLESASPLELQRFFRMGAADFCLAPLRLEDLLPRILRWSQTISMAQTVARQLERSLGMKQLIGQSPAFIEAINKIPKLAQSDANVLITGETGTGKEMCARAIHQLGPRASHPFIPINCGAIPSELVENELFGHEAGAFTGATTPVRGVIHDADGGTVFLDEIDSLPLQTQVKFLRFLQSHEYRPLGARKISIADVRIIAATNADVERGVQSGKFRADLFYRLNVLPLRLPPLRHRPEDIALLSRHFLASCARESAAPIKQLSQGALEKLLVYNWPGNIRELENVIERALVLTDQPVIGENDIYLPGASISAGETSFKVLKAHAIAEFETAYVRRVLAANNGNISKAARTAKKNRRAFWELMRKHDITLPPATTWAEPQDKYQQSAGQICPS